MYTEDDAAWDAYDDRGGEDITAELEEWAKPSHTALMRRDNETVHINGYPQRKQIVLTYPPVTLAPNAEMMGAVFEVPVADERSIAYRYAKEIDRHLAEGWTLAHSTAALI